jgi:hypothetical protein
LNKRIRRKPFPIPKIQELLHKLKGFQYATSFLGVAVMLDVTLTGFLVSFSCWVTIESLGEGFRFHFISEALLVSPWFAAVGATGA